MKTVALIPAYNPSEYLPEIVKSLAESGFPHIIVVNDGSSDSSKGIFYEIEGIENVTLIRHAVNLGKGAALKTGLNHVLCYFGDSIGVVTLDADGQHLAEDALKVAKKLEENPDSLIMGVRRFDRAVPLRSRIGNTLTKYMFRLLIGKMLTDTQTGLRGIPQSLIPTLLKIDSAGYEFELDMLLACKYTGRSIIEQEIRTVYVDSNKASHFNPIVDSMKIYFILFRFMLASSLTAIIDYTIFWVAYSFSFSLISSHVSARFIALLFNYSLVKKMVFYSDKPDSKTFPKYLSLVLFSGFISYNLIKILMTAFGLNVITAKVIAELLIFLANFAIQRDFIFTRNRNGNRTDWDSYYSKPFKPAAFTRRITGNVLCRLMKKYTDAGNDRFLIGELGGANSSFFDSIITEFKPAEYHIIDNNRLGLLKFRERVKDSGSVILHNGDVLNINLNLALDMVYSVGLIEHFLPEDTRKAVEAHFQILRLNGIAILSFPTPTFLYRISRVISETLGLWIFHDERPVTEEEISNILKDHGKILHSQIIWPILFTQRIVVVRKNSVVPVYNHLLKKQPSSNFIDDDLRILER